MLQQNGGELLKRFQANYFTRKGVLKISSTCNMCSKTHIGIQKVLLNNWLLGYNFFQKLKFFSCEQKFKKGEQDKQYFRRNYYVFLVLFYFLLNFCNFYFISYIQNILRKKDFWTNFFLKKYGLKGVIYCINILNLISCNSFLCGEKSV